MNQRELAREYFNKCGLSYDIIEINDIYKLIQILNRKIAEVDCCSLMINTPKLKGTNQNIVFKNERLVFAEIRVNGTYFDDREAITFNGDGYIGFCGWADMHNMIPFVEGFKEWCDYMKGKVKC